MGQINLGKVVGAPGVNGITPHIGANGNWWIGETDTGVNARGTDGVTPNIGTNGNWRIGSRDTGVKAQGLVPNIQIGTVSTLAAGSSATVTRAGTNENPLFNFGIPHGADGTSSGGNGGNALLVDALVILTLDGSQSSWIDLVGRKDFMDGEGREQSRTNPFTDNVIVEVEVGSHGTGETFNSGFTVSGYENRWAYGGSDRYGDSSVYPTAKARTRMSVGSTVTFSGFINCGSRFGQDLTLSLYNEDANSGVISINSGSQSYSSSNFIVLKVWAA